MSNHFSLLSGVAEYDEGFSVDEILKWSDLAKKALAKNSCAVNKRTVAKKFSVVDYNDTINKNVALFVSQNPFLVINTASFEMGRLFPDRNVFTDPKWVTTLKLTTPLILNAGKQQSTKEHIVFGRRKDDSPEVLSDVMVICEIIEFPKTALSLFKDLV